MYRIALSTVILGMLLLAPGVASAALIGQSYTISALPSDAAPAFGAPKGLNEEGDVAGLLAGTSPTTQAARWDGRSWKTMGNGEASGINRSGEVVGFLNVAM